MTFNKYDIISRYLIILILGIFNLYIIYLVFTPLTVIPSYLILNSIYHVKLVFPNELIVNNVSVLLVQACIAGAAYFLLFALNLTVPMQTNKRIKSLFYSILIFLGLNILRITIFVPLYLSGYTYFDVAHKFVWYFGSTILIVIIWFSEVLIFKIKDIPIVSDVNNIISNTKTKN